MSKYKNQKHIEDVYREISGKKDLPGVAVAATYGHATTARAAAPNGRLIHKREDVATPLSDAQIIERCRKAKNAPKFASLFDDGNLSGHDDDASRADAALLGILTLHTRDPAQLESIWERSALAEREKFGRDDYRRLTIDDALEKAAANDAAEWRTPPAAPAPRPAPVSSSHSPLGESEMMLTTDEPDGPDSSDESNEPKLVWFADLGEPKPRVWLIKDLCAEGYPLVAFGAGGVAKSFGMLQAGIAIASGHEQWFGLDIMQHGTVLYVDFELDQEEQHRRVHDLCQGLSVPVPRKLGYISGVAQTVESTFKAAIKASVQYAAVAVIIDSLGLALQGDMSDAKDVLEFYRKYLDPFRKAKVTPLVIDHEGKLQAGEKHKNKSPIGSAYKAWASRSVLQFARDSYDEETRTLRVRIRHHKSNFGPLLAPFGVSVQLDPGRIVTEHYDLEDADMLEEDTVSGRDRVRACLEADDATVVEIAKYCDLAEGTVRNILSRDLRGEVDSYQEGRSKKYTLIRPEEDQPEPPEEDPNQGRFSEDL